MKITNFEHTGLDEIESWINQNNVNDITKNDLKECLKYINISFVLEEIDRVQSTLICELKDSYVQQSQRYVAIKEDAFDLPKFETEDKEKGEKLIKRAFDLYDKMSKLKDGEFKGRPKVSNYLYGIPIEDARYILPLAAKTNISISMSGNKLIDFFCLMNSEKYLNIFENIKKEFVKLLPSSLSLLLLDIQSTYNSKFVEKFYENEFAKINHDNNMIILNAFENIDLKVGLGAITSTQAKTPSKVLEQWGEQAAEKAKGVTDRVLGYGHDSISEQARTTFGMMCSMVTYHQQIRHRLSENYREELGNIIRDVDRKVVIPQTIKDSIFYKEFEEVASDFKAFRLHILQKYGEDKALKFLLNCDEIKLIISTNARIDIKMLAERICLNAQWEIRDLSTKKLEILRGLSQVLYINALPSCIYGKCKEGKLTCGKQALMKEKFALPKVIEEKHQ